MNSRLFSNPSKLIYIFKINANTLSIPVDCLKLLTSRMCSDSLRDTESPKSTNLNFTQILKPPCEVKGIKQLDDKCAFDKTVRFPVIFISDCHITKLTPILKPYMVKLMRFRGVRSNTEWQEERATIGDKHVIMNPDVVSSFLSIDESVRIKLKELDVFEENFTYAHYTIGFDNWSIEDLIEAVLPEGLRFSGYSMIGHIAHFNLRDELLDYKYVLGEIIRNKVKLVRTVVNKIKSIESAYRNFEMELICGENEMKTKMKENGCTYEMEFSKVYWNSRLSMEHERIVNLIKNNDVLYDVFAGIGPFVIPAAKKGCLVVANDLNPDSFLWLKHNVRINKVAESVECFNEDARSFITVHMRKHLLKIRDLRGNDQFKVHITMNLPAAAVTFINDFRGLFTSDEYKKVPKDLICHLYCFIKEEVTAKRDERLLLDRAKELVEMHLQRKFGDNLVEVKKVRNVAPCKDMFRVSFLFEPEFLIRGSEKRCNDDDNLDDFVMNKK